MPPVVARSPIAARGDTATLAIVAFLRDGKHMSAPRNESSRRAIAATCTQHGGTPGFTNLLVSKRGGDIEVDPHVTGCCLIRLDEDGARTLCAAITELLG